MSDDHGPLHEYQVIWKSGHVETIRAHQVLLPPPALLFMGDRDEPRRVIFHGEIDGHWRLILDAAYDDITSIRNLDASEKGA